MAVTIAPEINKKGNLMNITHSDFINSIFYPAGGTDIQAILRFSSLSSTIISPTVSNYLTQEKYKELFEIKCQTLNNEFKREIIKLVNIKPINMSHYNDKKYVSISEGIFSEHDKRNYMNAFSQYMNGDLSAIEFTFERKVGNNTRIIRWIAIKAEGLATLIFLTRIFKSSPKIVCTIQSGILEYPGSLFVRMIEKLTIIPDIWVRGYWPCMKNTRDAISSFPPYSNNIQDYGYWNSCLGVNSQGNEDNPCTPPLSYVRAFSLDNDKFTPKDFSIIHSSNPKREIRFVHNSLTSVASQYNYIFTSKRISKTLGHPNSNTILWEDLSNHNSNLYPTLISDDVIEVIKEKLKKFPNAKIAITPIGFEDEGVAFEDFLHCSDNDMSLDVYYHGSLDYHDLYLKYGGSK